MTLAQIPNGNACAGKPTHHVGGASTAGESNTRVWRAFIDHALVPQWASAFPVRSPVCREGMNSDALRFRPIAAKAVSAGCLAFDQFADAMLAMHGGKRPIDQRAIPKITPTRDHDFHTEAYHFQAERATKCQH